MEHEAVERNIEGQIKKITAQNGLPWFIFESVEDVIRDYCNYEDYFSGIDSCPSIRHGEGVVITAKDKKISWHFNPIYDNKERVTICFKQGGGWVDDCYLDELPVKFLLHLLFMIKDRCPLRDERPGKVINELKDALGERRKNKYKKAVKNAIANIRVKEW